MSRRPTVTVSPLESRLLLSAAPLDIAIPTDGETTAFSTTASAATIESPEETTTNQDASTRRELVILDSRVHDIEQLVDGLTSNEQTQFDVFVLDADRDGVEQISEILATFQDVDAVHLISHGEDGQVRLGDTWLGESNLDAYAGELTRWRDALSADADLLFYGCDLAGSASGRTFLEAVSTLTGADVAASVDDTGHAQFGANWALEYSVGDIESETPFRGSVQSNWEGKLATITVDTFDDIVDSGDGQTSLREAIITTNAGAGGDVIDLETIGAGTFRLTITGGAGGAETGDFDITQSVTIRGVDANSTVIDASGLANRIFEVEGGVTLDISDLTLTGGSSADGAGIKNKGTLNLTDVALNGNTATEGAAIFATSGSTTTLEQVELSFNDANRGGALYLQGSNVNLINTTISGNHADAEGGGVYVEGGTVDIRNTTIAFNTAGAGGRGIENTGGGSVTLTNTILHNPDGANLVGSFLSGGTNINSDGSTSFGSNVDPDLDPVLRLNAANTRTHAISVTSAARNSGTEAGSPSTDQRGVGRTGSVDIGAYEFSPLLTPTNEQLVNTTTIGQQSTFGNSAVERGSHQAVAVDGAGNSVVVWTDSAGTDGDGLGVFAQRFDIDGNAVGSEFRVNTATAGDQYDATVAMDESGRFVIAFTSNNGDADLYLRRFNADGTAIDANDVLINHGQTGGDQIHAEIAANASGQIIVAWQNDGDGIYGRMLEMSTVLAAADLSAQDDFRVDNDNSSVDPSVDINDSGRIVVTWEDNGDLYGRRYDFGNTSALSGKHDLNIAGSGEGDMVVAVQSDNEFVIAYRSNVFLFNGIWTRAFNEDGSAKSTARSVQLGSGQAPSISIDANDNYLVTWQNSDADGTGVFVRAFNQNANAISGTTQINTTTTGTQQFASVAMIDTQNFIVVWSGNGTQAGNVDTLGVFMRRAGTGLLPSDISPDTFTIDDGVDTSGGSSLGTLTATDADVGETFSWRILPGLDGSSFSIGGGGNDELILTDGVIDSATKASYQVRVEVVDGTDNSYNEVLTVNVNPANAAPVIGGTVAGQTVDDNATISPFSGVTISDTENDQVSIVIRLSGGDDNGGFTAGSLGPFTKTDIGEYTLSSRTIPAAQTAIRGLEFDPSENQAAVGSTVTTTFTIEVADATGSGSDANTTVDATSVNNAPTLTSGAISDVAEDDADPTGDTVATIFSGNFSDSDPGASLSGIAVFANNANAVTEGTWQYSSDGTTWRDVGTVSSANALTIASGSSIRFVPVSGFTGTPTTLGIRGLDDSFGGSFSTTPTSETRVTIDVSSPGGTTPISDPSTTITVSVVNNATPTVGNVSSLLLTDDKTNTSPFGSITLSDAESDNVSVVIRLSNGDDNGVFTAGSLGGFTKTGVGEYSLATTTIAAAQSALRGLVFDPTENQVVVASQVTTVFTLEISDATDTLTDANSSVSAMSINDAPTLNAGTLPSIGEAETNSTGDTVANAFSGQFGDPDVSSSFSGIAVIGNNANAVSQGVWQYSSDGTTWRDIGTVSDAAALTISVSSRVRFVPAAGFSGTPTALDVRGLDNTHFGFSTTPTSESRVTLDTTSPGGTSSISDPATTLSIDVTGNAAPVIGGTVANQAVDDTNTVSPFASVTLSDPESDNVSVVITLSGGDDNGVFTAGSLGSFAKTGVGQYTLTSTAPNTAQAAIRALVFAPTENQVAAGAQVTTTFTLNVTDGIDATSDSGSSVVATSINDAPTLSAATLSNISEDEFDSGGDLISTLFAGAFADADTGASLSGIAVLGNTANSGTEGVWQYSSDASTWRDIGTVSNTNALSLAAGTRLRFVPVAGFTGSPDTLNVRGLDDSYSGGFSTTPTTENRVTIDTSSPGGTTPISDLATTVSVTVENNATPTITDISPGILIGDTATTSPFSGITLGDAENDNVEVVVRLSGGDANGSFAAASLGGFSQTGAGEYSLGSTTLAAAQAALRGLVFDPTVNQVAVGGQVTTGFTVEVSDATDTISDANTNVTVNSINDAPTLLAGSLTSIQEDDVASGGDTVADAFSGQFSDPDVASTFSGILVTGNNANAGTEGIWQYSSDGTTWRDIGSVSNGGALAISAATRVRFVPLIGFTGSPTALDVRGLDDTYSGGFSTTPTSENRITIDASASGGSTAITAGVTTLSVSVIDNATPVIGGLTGGQGVDDNGTLNPFSTATLSDAENDDVSVVIQLSGGDDNGSFTAGSLGAFVKTGVGEYRLASSNVAAAQSAMRALVFAPTENQVAVGSTVTTIFSVDVADDTDTASNANTSVLATSINDAPTLTAAVLASINENDFNPGGETVSTLFAGQFSDPDSGASFGGIAVVGNTANAISEGSWQYSSDGTTWRDIGTVGDANGLTISAGSRIRFVPVSGFSGSPTALTVRGLDETHSGYSTTPTTETRITVNATTAGGSTPISDPATTISTSVTNNADPVLAGDAGNQTVNDDATIAPFSSVTISDAEGDAVTVVVQLSGGDANGSFTAGSLGAFTQTGAGEYTLTSSTPAAAQAAIRGLVFAPTQNQVAVGSQVTTTLSIHVSDATGSALNSGTSVLATSINNAPTLNAGTLPSIVENDFSPAGSTIATIFTGQFTDVDPSAVFSGIAVIGNAADPINEGEWQYSSDGTTWRSIGTVGNTNALAIAAGSRLRFVPVAGFSGTPSALSVRGLDETHTGFSTTPGTESRVTLDASTAGGATPISDPATTVSTSVLAANDAPTNTVPASISTSEATVTTVTGVSISDADAGTASLRTRLQVTGGVLNVTLSGSALVVGGANGSGDLTIEGSLGDLNATLGTLTYQGNAGVTGFAADSITVTTDDLGNSGAGGAQTDTDSIQVNIAAVNQAPAVTAPAGLTATEDTPTVVTGISVADPDAGSSNIRVVLEAARGSVTVDGSVSGGVTSISGNGTARVVLVGTVAEINTTLGSASGVLYQAVSNYSGADTLDVTANDLGNSGLGGAQSDQQQIAVTVVAENDAPVARNDLFVTTGRGVRSAAPGVLVNDSDIDGPALTASLVTGPSNGNMILNADGSFVYVAARGFSGADTFTYIVSDGSLTSNVATVRITVVAPPNPQPLPPTDTSTDPPTPEPPDDGTTTPPTNDTSPPIVGTPPGTSSTPTSSNPFADPFSPDQEDDNEIQVVQPNFIDEASTYQFVSIARAELAFKSRLDQSSDAEVSSGVLNDFRFASQLGLFWQQVDQMGRQIDADGEAPDMYFTGTAAATSAISVGYVIWLLKGGHVLAGLLAQVPAWRLIDPIPILAHLDEEDDNAEDDSLQDLMERDDEDQSAS
ncbi:MAG: DUF4347 domain-containing protein [Planctomycetota bacterium]